MIRGPNIKVRQKSEVTARYSINHANFRNNFLNTVLTRFLLYLIPSIVVVSRFYSSSTNRFNVLGLQVLVMGIQRLPLSYLLLYLLA